VVLREGRQCTPPVSFKMLRSILTNSGVFVEVFDDAWDVVQPMVACDPIAMEAARLRLANLVLAVFRSGLNDAESIKSVTVEKARLRAPAFLSGSKK
jgi:hypothetical protein